MSKTFINRPKEDEPTKFDDWSQEEIDQYLDTLDFQGLQQLFRELCGPYARPAPIKKEAREAIHAWIILRQAELEGHVEPATDDQGNQLYRLGQRCFKVTQLGLNYAAGRNKRN